LWFGALAGISKTLIVASIGLGKPKLFCRSDRRNLIEASRRPFDARAQRLPHHLILGSRRYLLAFCVSRPTNIAPTFRNSTMVGICWLLRLGGTLFSAFQRFDYDFCRGDSKSSLFL